MPGILSLFATRDTVLALQRDADERQGAFNARPYFRAFSGLIGELCTPVDPDSPAGFAALSGLAIAFNALQPLRVPGFGFAWLELISHK